MKVKLTEFDLQNIKSNALRRYIDDNPKKLFSEDSAVVFAYFTEICAFLTKKGCEIEIQLPLIADSDPLDDRIN
jgi:hypothetical protein